ncbi:MAG: hypothetical protein RLZZ519_2051 [Bacteroidota bacterium]|jgi:hypothetical protein
METQNTFAAEFAANTQALLDWADRLRPEQLDLRPASGKWSVLEVLEHIFIVEKAAAKLSRPDAEPVDRDLEKSRNRMTRGMADLNQPFAGGSAIDPKGRFADYAEWRAAFAGNRAEMLQLGNEKGWSGLCAEFPHPYFGNLTRAEWMIFSGIHANRHLAQMQQYVG